MAIKRPSLNFPRFEKSPIERVSRKYYEKFRKSEIPKPKTKFTTPLGDIKFEHQSFTIRNDDIHRCLSKTFKYLQNLKTTRDNDKFVYDPKLVESVFKHLDELKE